jgi:hypothetical protein
MLGVGGKLGVSIIENATQEFPFTCFVIGVSSGCGLLPRSVRGMDIYAVPQEFELGSFIFLGVSRMGEVTTFVCESDMFTVSHTSFCVPEIFNRGLSGIFAKDCSLLKLYLR